MVAVDGSTASQPSDLSPISLRRTSSLGSLVSNMSPSVRRVQRSLANNTEDIPDREGTFDPDTNPPQLPSSPEASSEQDSRFYEDSCDMHFEFIDSCTHSDNYFTTHSTPSSGRHTNANVTADDEDEIEVLQTILPDVEILSDSEWESDFENICVRPKAYKALVEFHTVCLQMFYLL
jgi:hypothetical protein